MINSTHLPKGFIFDLDGVITDTARYHYLAWKNITDSLHLNFDETMNECLKGVSRIRSLEIILEENNASDLYTLEEKIEIVEKKNKIYVDMLENISEHDILPGIKTLIEQAKNLHIKIAIASASKNARHVLQRLGIIHLFDYISDVNLIKNPKPDPEIFLDCAQHLGLTPQECIGFEDSQVGIEAIKRAKMLAIGISIPFKMNNFYPDQNVCNTNELELNDLIHFYQLHERISCL